MFCNNLLMQEELLDQHLFLGLIPLSLVAVRTDPGTALHSLRGVARAAAGWAVQSGVQLVEGVLHAAGLQ